MLVFNPLPSKGMTIKPTTNTTMPVFTVGGGGRGEAIVNNDPHLVTCQ